jgi:hypothetical protein
MLWWRLVGPVERVEVHELDLGENLVTITGGCRTQRRLGP